MFETPPCLNRVNIQKYIFQLKNRKKNGLNSFKESRRTSPLVFVDGCGYTFVALQLCPPLQFGPLTYQPIECVFISSNQSAL